MKMATLALEDGTILQGAAFGAETDAVFELVFNTSMTGYQEIITDPSYRGQGILFTASHIGNVGINPEDNESQIPQASAVVLRSLSPLVSNWRATLSLSDWLQQHGIPGIAGIDTRYLTRKLRQQGTQKAALSTLNTSGEDLLAMARAWPGLDGRDTVQDVTRAAATIWQGDAGDRWVRQNEQERESAPSVINRTRPIIVFDFGVKHNILRHLATVGAQIILVPAYTSFEEVMELHPQGIVLSNGPGDPAGLPTIARTVRQIIESGVPTFGICLGHQLIGLAYGGVTQRLKFGHHSGNHPVLDARTGKVLVTAQNHNYAILADSLDPAEVEITHISLNDRTVEGMRLRHKPVFSVQFHPEASPGPHDAQGLFRIFFEMVATHAKTY